MKTAFTPKVLRWLVILALVIGWLIAVTGCQTFSLTEEQWQKQQRGGVVDQRTGQIVGDVGTAGYYGFLIGETVAAVLRK